MSATIPAVSRRTRTIANDNLVDAGEIEDGEFVARRWVWATLADRVAQLENKAKGGKRLFSEVVPIPLL